MSIRQLSLTDFRNLKSNTLDFHPSLNLIYGDNGSGKTSLIEAIHVLCQARSFRQHQLKKCIQHGKSSFLLFGRFDGYKAGLSKSDKKLEIRIDGESVQRRSTLVGKTPVNILNADSFELITGSPELKRQYIDWCLFHVEHTYTENWVKFKHALRQRNKLLKIRKDQNLIDYWDDYIVGPSQVLKTMRKDYCLKIANILNQELSELLDDIDIRIEYQPGWSTGLSLQQALQKSRERDIRSGFTQVGIHRDNLNILSNGKPASDVLSRGQLKRLSLALLVAGLRIVSDATHKPLILLIDDLRAELDEEGQLRIYQSLFEMNIQLIITNIDGVVPMALQGKEFKMFHVEHGIINARKFS